MTRLPRRQSAQAWNLAAPDHMQVPVPEKRKPNYASAKEWELQFACIKAIRERQKFDKDLAYIAPGAAQNYLKPRQRAFAKGLGWQRGLADIWLMRRQSIDGLAASRRIIKWHIVELKIPGRGLTPEQRAWFTWLEAGGIFCSRVDSLQQFLTILDSF